MGEVPGRAVERLLLEMLDPDAHRPERERLPARLVVRASSAAPPDTPGEWGMRAP
jgi:DNA-binding LacI/PurR family transcriptional regulator